MNSTATILAGGTLRAKTAPTLARNARTIRESRKGAAMIEFTRILCPIDFSETSARALTYATALARWYDAHLEVLHVLPAFEQGSPPARFDTAGGAWPSREQLMVEIEGAIAAAGASDLKSRALAQEGRAHEIIASRARALPADLLVMGTHGRSGFNRLLLGSVTEKVLRQVTCPVLTVPPGGATHGRGACRLQEDPVRHRLLPVGAEGAALRVGPRAPGRGLHALIAQEPTTWCEIEEVVAVDRAYKAILRHAEEATADLIVMGAQGTGGLELMLYGSNTHHVVRAAPCPVLTVRA